MVDIGSIFEVTTTDVILIAVLLLLVYRWWKRQAAPEIPHAVPIPVEPMAMADFTAEELKKYDGEQDKHILLAVDHIIFDVSRSRSFYGKGGAYEKLAGHDATRALGGMDVNDVRDEYDNYEGISESNMDTAIEWKDTFLNKYPTVGRLVETADQKQNYEGRMSSIRSIM